MLWLPCLRLAHLKHRVPSSCQASVSLLHSKRATIARAVERMLADCFEKAFYFMCMCVLSFVFFLASLRTNLVLALVLLCATLGFGLLTGGLFKLADGEMVLGEKLVYATGATFFTACLLGWYLLLSIMLSVMDLPSPPVFDLSTKIRGVSERRKRDYKDE